MNQGPCTKSIPYNTTIMFCASGNSKTNLLKTIDWTSKRVLKQKSYVVCYIYVLADKCSWKYIADAKIQTDGPT